MLVYELCRLDGLRFHARYTESGIQKSRGDTQNGRHANGEVIS
jgi:hypothetical protein